MYILRFTTKSFLSFLKTAVGRGAIRLKRTTDEKWKN